LNHFILAAESAVAGAMGEVGSNADSWFVTDGWFDWFAPTGTAFVALLLVVLCLVAWATNLIGLPGNWFSVAILAFYAWMGPQESRAAIGYTAVAVAFIAALIGELVEFAASAFGAKRAGASRRSTMYAVAGSMIGAISGALIGVPVPVIGSILAAILFGGIGAAAGAIYGEWSDGRAWQESWTIGHAAFWGRTFGVFGKIGTGIIILAIALFGVLL
jgi:uncharacterized protein YqgC (DUF456 family)